MLLTLGKDAGAGVMGGCVLFSFLVAQVRPTPPAPNASAPTQ